MRSTELDIERIKISNLLLCSLPRIDETPQPETPYSPGMWVVVIEKLKVKGYNFSGAKVPLFAKSLAGAFSFRAVAAPLRQPEWTA